MPSDRIRSEGMNLIVLYTIEYDVIGKPVPTV